MLEGIGDCGFGGWVGGCWEGDRELWLGVQIPNPQTPIPNPQSPIPI